MDTPFLCRVRPGALLMYPVYGAIVDTKGLTGAVLAGRVRAALDVPDPEPLPDGHRLWSAPGALIGRRYQTGEPCSTSSSRAIRTIVS